MILEKKVIGSFIDIDVVIYWGYKGRKLVITVTDKYGQVLIWRTTRLLGFLGKRQYTKLARIALLNSIIFFLKKKNIKNYGLIIKNGYKPGLVKKLVQTFSYVSNLKWIFLKTNTSFGGCSLQKKKRK